jgi:proteasome lid subunit RPN8/RPN11
VHFALDRNLVSMISSHATPDRRRTVLVGAGSLGSQLALNLGREGRFDWSVVDGDVVLPHNLARHGLLNEALAAPKATALAAQLSHFLAEPVKAFPCDVMYPGPALEKDLTVALADAELIIDASASVAAARYLSDLPTAKARRVCAFFNPSGTSVVLLVEDQERSITLRDLEAQYHRLVQAEPALSNHLRADSQGIRYSGSCRTLTNRIAASRAALLSALAARGIQDSLTITGAEIRIWNCNEDGSVTVLRRERCAVRRIKFGDWSVHYDEGLLARLAALRTSKLPNETGGILLGIADMMRKEIHVVNALPQPEDSKGWVTGFERGVVGLADALNQAIEASMFQLRYVGEWHSHPDLSSTWPSTTDIAQLFWLQSELEAEGLPALMAIAGQSGEFTWVVKPQPPTAAAPQSEPQGACNARS